jgi:hypothetical protein
VPDALGAGFDRAGARSHLLDARLGAAEEAVPQRDAGAHVVIPRVLEHAVAACVDRGGHIRQQLAARGAVILPGGFGLGFGGAHDRVGQGAQHRVVAAGQPGLEPGRARLRRRRQAPGQFLEAGFGLGEGSLQLGAASLGRGDIAFDAGQIPLRRRALLGSARRSPRETRPAWSRTRGSLR